MKSSLIRQVRGRRIWDSRGRPTLEVEIVVQSGVIGIGAAPAGASRGENEAIEVRDGGSRLGGRDVQRAIGIIEESVGPALIGVDVSDQELVDSILDQLDQTPTRSVLGGNVSVATSIAALKTAAACVKAPLWSYLSPEPAHIPRPEIQIMGGGAHAGRALEVQDFMVIPLSASVIEDALVQVAEIYMRAGALLAADHPQAGVADEGGHWPVVANADEALSLLCEAIERAGLVPGVDVGLSLDIAASEFFQDGFYLLASEDLRLEPSAWIDRLSEWVSAYPIVAIEDPVESSDDIGMREVTRRLSHAALVVGDDYLVTSAERVRRAAAGQAATAALIKPNQAGTITAAREASEAARGAGMATIVSARSGETEDTTVADLAVGWAADLLKVGSITRGERTAKWNHLIRIADAGAGGLQMAPFPLTRSAKG